MKGLWILTVLAVLSVSFPLPVAAADTAAGGLPPFSQWPILGPVLHWLGLVPEAEKAAPEAAPVLSTTPTAASPEYIIRTMADLLAVQQLPKQQTVRLTASESDINALIAQRAAEIDGLDKLTVSLSDGEARAFVQIHRELLEKNGVDVPFLKGDVFTASGTVSLKVQDCEVRVSVDALTINGKNMGFTKFVQSLLNKQLSQQWPDEACVQRVDITSGQVTVQGYRR